MKRRRNRSVIVAESKMATILQRTNESPFVNGGLNTFGSSTVKSIDDLVGPAKKIVEPVLGLTSSSSERTSIPKTSKKEPVSFEKKTVKADDLGGYRSHLHQIWWTGMKDLLKNQNYQSRQQSWMRQFPKSRFKFWDQNDLNLFVKDHFPKFHQIWFDDLKTPQEKIQVAKYLILSVCGGIIIDVDLECFGPLPLKSDPHLLFIGDAQNINLQLLGSESNAGFWKHVIIEVTRRILRRRHFQDNLSFDQFVGKKFISEQIASLQASKSPFLNRMVFLDPNVIQKSQWTNMRNYILGPSDGLISIPQESLNDTKISPIYDHCEHRWTRISFEDSKPYLVGFFVLFFIAVIVVGFILYEHLYYTPKNGITTKNPDLGQFNDEFADINGNIANGMKRNQNRFVPHSPASYHNMEIFEKMNQETASALTSLSSNASSSAFELE